jgi:hypothetical protein
MSRARKGYCAQCCGPLDLARLLSLKRVYCVKTVFFDPVVNLLYETYGRPDMLEWDQLPDIENLCGHDTGGFREQSS